LNFEKKRKPSGFSEEGKGKMGEGEQSGAELKKNRFKRQGETISLAKHG